jgi:hypothetical protein
MKYFFLALSMLVLIASCNKDPQPTTSKENLLRAKKWKIKDGTMTVKQPNGKDTVLSYTSFIDSCYMDDYIKFDSNHFGSLFTGTVHCSPADPASRSFTWNLMPNETYIDLFNGFNTIFCVNTIILPYHFDTLEKSPLKLDTIVGTLDTIPGFTKQFIVLDTVRELRYNQFRIPNFDLYGAEIRNLTSSSFKLKFSFKCTRLDSTGLRAGAPYNNPPATLPDTADYILNFESF